MPKISIIVAKDSMGAIGWGDQLPWHISSDLKRFKKITMNKPIVMGRKTHESIGRVLADRENIVLSHNPDYSSTGCTVCHSLEEAIRHCQHQEEMIIIGGRSLYAKALPIADRIYLTEVKTSVLADTYFPEFDPSLWQEYKREDCKSNKKQRDQYDYSFVDLVAKG